MPRDPARPLTPELIAREGLALVDERSLDELTMRRLAARLDVGPMALYRHVANKDALVRLMSDAILAEALDEVLARTGHDLVRSAAVHLHDHLVDHPGRLAVVAASATTASSAVYSIRLARSLVAGGLDETAAVLCVRTLVAYVLGAALLAVSESVGAGAEVDGVEVVRRLGRDADPLEAGAAERMLATGLRADFRAGLDAVLRGFLGR